MALVVPKNLGYAGIAGIPLQNGLYAAAGAILYAVFAAEVLERDGVLGRIGDDKIHGNVDHAVAAQLAAGEVDRTDA